MGGGRCCPVTRSPVAWALHFFLFLLLISNLRSLGIHRSRENFDVYLSVSLLPASFDFLTVFFFLFARHLLGLILGENNLWETFRIMRLVWRWVVEQDYHFILGSTLNGFVHYSLACFANHVHSVMSWRFPLSPGGTWLDVKTADITGDMDPQVRGGGGVVTGGQFGMG